MNSQLCCQNIQGLRVVGWWKGPNVTVNVQHVKHIYSYHENVTAQAGRLVFFAGETRE